MADNITPKAQISAVPSEAASVPSASLSGKASSSKTQPEATSADPTTTPPAKDGLNKVVPGTEKSSGKTQPEDTSADIVATPPASEGLNKVVPGTEKSSGKMKPYVTLAEIMATPPADGAAIKVTPGTGSSSHKTQPRTAPTEFTPTPATGEDTVARRKGKTQVAEEPVGGWFPSEYEDGEDDEYSTIKPEPFDDYEAPVAPSKPSKKKAPQDVAQDSQDSKDETEDQSHYYSTEDIPGFRKARVRKNTKVTMGDAKTLAGQRKYDANIDVKVGRQARDVRTRISENWRQLAQEEPDVKQFGREATYVKNVDFHKIVNSQIFLGRVLGSPQTTKTQINKVRSFIHNKDGE